MTAALHVSEMINKVRSRIDFLTCRHSLACPKFGLILTRSQKTGGDLTIDRHIGARPRSFSNALPVSACRPPPIMKSGKLETGGTTLCAIGAKRIASFRPEHVRGGYNPCVLFVKRVGGGMTGGHRKSNGRFHHPARCRFHGSHTWERQSPLAKLPKANEDRKAANTCRIRRCSRPVLPCKFVASQSRKAFPPRKRMLECAGGIHITTRA